jgi:hypothetical protein
VRKRLALSLKIGPTVRNFLLNATQDREIG